MTIMKIFHMFYRDLQRGNFTASLAINFIIMLNPNLISNPAELSKEDTVMSKWLHAYMAVYILRSF